MDFYTLKDFDFSGKIVLVRVDFNVPLDKKGRITDDKRIRESIPTIKHLMKQGARVVLASHLGKPKGVDESLRMNTIAKQLEKLLKHPVIKVDDCIGAEVEDEINETTPAEVVLLENLRFHEGEEKNDRLFAMALADLADFYVNDAFGSSHRNHASVVGVAEFLPSCAGFLLEKEIKELSRLFSPKTPFYAFMGGAKISDKINIVESLAKKADKVLLGGAMIFTFYKALGYEVGKSLFEKDKLGLAKAVLKKYHSKIVLPEDVVVANTVASNAKTKVVPMHGIPKGWQGVDIGPKTLMHYSDLAKRAKTIFWNGPMGIFEIKKFSKGTIGLAKAVASAKALTIIGGGDSASAIEQAKLQNKITHLSTGGGAALEFIEQETLPGIEALKKNKDKYCL